MALEQIIADLDDLEERVENLNVDQKTNEDILLNVLKRVDETEKDLRKVRQGVAVSEVVVGQVALEYYREPNCSMAGRRMIRLKITFFKCNRFVPHESILVLRSQRITSGTRTPGMWKSARIAWRMICHAINLFSFLTDQASDIV